MKSQLKTTPIGAINTSAKLQRIVKIAKKKGFESLDMEEKDLVMEILRSFHTSMDRFVQGMEQGSSELEDIKLSDTLHFGIDLQVDVVGKTAPKKSESRKDDFLGTDAIPSFPLSVEDIKEDVAKEKPDEYDELDDIPPIPMEEPQKNDNMFERLVEKSKKDEVSNEISADALFEDNEDTGTEKADEYEFELDLPNHDDSDLDELEETDSKKEEIELNFDTNELDIDDLEDEVESQKQQKEKKEHVDDNDALNSLNIDFDEFEDKK